MVMVFNATFNNISVISWRSVSLAEEITGKIEYTPSVGFAFITLEVLIA